MFGQPGVLAAFHASGHSCWLGTRTWRGTCGGPTLLGCRSMRSSHNPKPHPHVYSSPAGLSFGFPFCHTGPAGNNINDRPYLRRPGVGANLVDPNENAGQSATACNGEQRPPAWPGCNGADSTWRLRGSGAAGAATGRPVHRPWPCPLPSWVFPALPCRPRPVLPARHPGHGPPHRPPGHALLQVGPRRQLPALLRPLHPAGAARLLEQAAPHRRAVRESVGEGGRPGGRAGRDAGRCQRVPDSHVCAIDLGSLAGTERHPGLCPVLPILSHSAPCPPRGGPAAGS